MRRFTTGALSERGYNLAEHFAAIAKRLRSAPWAVEAGQEHNL